MAAKTKKKAGPFISSPRAKKTPGQTVRPGGTQVIKAKGKKPLAFKKGALTQQAAQHGMTPKEFCKTKAAQKGKAKKRCTFAFKGALAAGRKTVARGRKGK